MPARVKARVKGVKGYINAMRPTWLSNPFPSKEYSRLASLIMFEEYLRVRLDSDREFAKRFDSIKEFDTIGCTCPGWKACHVDIIIKVWNERKLSNTD